MVCFCISYSAPLFTCPGVSQALKLLSLDLVNLGKLTQLNKIQEARSTLPLCSRVLVASLAQAGQKILAESDCFELHLFLFNVIHCFLTCVINDILTLQPARSVVSPATSHRVPAVNAKYFDEPGRNLEPSQESVCRGEPTEGMPSGTCHLSRLQQPPDTCVPQAFCPFLY